MNFLKQYEKLTVLIPQPVTSWLFKQLRVCLERQLTGKNPRIFLFDLYKLGYYAEINR